MWEMGYKKKKLSRDLANTEGEMIILKLNIHFI